MEISEVNGADSQVGQAVVETVLTVEETIQHVVNVVLVIELVFLI